MKSPRGSVAESWRGILQRRELRCSFGGSINEEAINARARVAPEIEERFSGVEGEGCFKAAASEFGWSASGGGTAEYPI